MKKKKHLSKNRKRGSYFFLSLRHLNNMIEYCYMSTYCRGNVLITACNARTNVNVANSDRTTKTRPFAQELADITGQQS